MFNSLYCLIVARKGLGKGLLTQIDRQTWANSEGGIPLRWSSPQHPLNWARTHPSVLSRNCFWVKKDHEGLWTPPASSQKQNEVLTWIGKPYPFQKLKACMLLTAGSNSLSWIAKLWLIHTIARSVSHPSSLSSDGEHASNRSWRDRTTLYSSWDRQGANCALHDRVLPVCLELTQMLQTYHTNCSHTFPSFMPLMLKSTSASVPAPQMSEVFTFTRYVVSSSSSRTGT